VEGGPIELNSVEIVDADGVKQIVQLKGTLMLPPPEHASTAGSKA
jgi:hypothetical protein